jgi:hypothetical protein
MHQDANNNTQVTHNLELFCNLEVMMGLFCIMLMLEGLNDLIIFSQQPWQHFVYNFVAIIKLCQTYFYC